MGNITAAERDRIMAIMAAPGIRFRHRKVYAALLTAGILAFLPAASGCGNGSTTGAGPVSPAVQSTAAGTAASQTPTVPTASLSLFSDSINSGSFAQPQVCTQKGGQDLSPQLSWAGAPAGTSGFAIIMDDEDPPCGQGDSACRHWSVFNIPASVTRLDAGGDTAPLGAISGENYKGASGYAGPCSPDRHTYHITVYALSGAVDDAGSQTQMTRSRFQSRYASLILAQATLAATFTP